MIARFIYATRGNVPDLIVKNDIIYRVLTDHLGSPRLIVDASTGAQVQQATFDEFGDVRGDTNPGFQPIGFAGGFYDVDTGLLRFGARDYDARTGRFMTKDPIGFAGGDANLYAYVMNDPINLVDPMGTDWVETTATISAGVGDGILETLSFGLWDGQAARSALGDSDQLVDTCSGSYKAARVAGTAIALAAYAGGAIPKSLTHFTTETGAMFIKGGGGILPSTGTTLFGDGVYAATFRTGFVPAASTAGIEVSGAGFMRIVPGAVFLKGGSPLTGAWFGAYGVFANRDMLGSGSGCGCQ